MMISHRTNKIKAVTIVLAVCMFFVFCYVGPLRTPMIVCSVFTLLLMNMLKTRKAVLRFSSETYVLFVLALTQLVRVFANAVAGTLSASQIVHFVCYMMFFVVVSMYRHIDNCFFSRFVNVALLFSFIGGPILGIYQFITKDYLYQILGESQQAAHSGVTYMMFSVNNGNSNYAAIHMMLAMYLSMIKYKMTSKSLYLIMALFSGIAVILTFSRATLLAVAVVMFLAKIIERRDINKTDVKQRRKYRRQVLAICLVLLCATLLMFNSIRDSIINYFSNTYALKNIQYKLSSAGADSRFDIWNAVVNMMKDASIDKLLIGFGDEYTMHLAEYCERVITAHNYILDQFARCGVIGLILSLCICVLLAKRSVNLLKKRNGVSRIIGAIMLSLLINYMFVAELDYVALIAIAITSSLNTEAVRI